MKNYLFELSMETIASGAECKSSTIQRLLAPLVDYIKTDNLGNIIGVKRCGIPGAKKILIDAHIDEITMIVTKIDECGFIHFENHAGVDAKILPGALVTILSVRQLTGVVASLPPHLTKDEDIKKVTPINELVIDVGLDYDSCTENVRVGDFIVLKSGCMDLSNHCVTGKSFDNRASVAIILHTLSGLKDIRISYDLYILFSMGEEFSGFGASGAAFDIYPDEAIVLDVSHAHSPAAPEGKTGLLGKGVMIGISPILSSEITNTLFSLANEYSISHQTEAMPGRTGTNADRIVCTRSGIPCAMLSLPLRYMHSPAEVVSLSDMASVSQLLGVYLKS